MRASVRSRASVAGLALVLMASLLGIAAPAVLAKAPTVREPKVTTKSDQAKDKIHPKLQKQMDAAPTTSLRFVARIVAGTNLDRYAERWFARPYVDPAGLTAAVGFAKPEGITKLASLPGVISLQLPESIVTPPRPSDPDVEAKRDTSLKAKIVRGIRSPGPAPTGWFHTTGAIHGSQDAWAKGYTGDGVTYMSNDSGADYCHPDLEGTWAYVDEATPYRGLPEMFDSYSSFVAANDFYLGTDFVAQGLAHYADTSKELRFAPSKLKGTVNGSYRPIGARANRTYKLPLTSKSGTYHIGSHPDQGLAEFAQVISREFFPGSARAIPGERAGVLVVDEHTAGVYDTVYVDLDYDYDFRNNAPARLTRDFSYQETACLDYDHDGLNDISGGLVYFISNGATSVPTLDWYWGIDADFYGNGDLVAFHIQDWTSPAGSHGQGTTSVATGQGVVRGNIYTGPGGPSQAGGKGLVVGPGKNVKSTQNGDFYKSPFIEDAYIYAGLGYDGVSGTTDDVQIMSNSWGFSDVDNDGLDFFSRYIDLLNRVLGPTSTFLFATGNGAAGYGTDTAVSPASGIGVGASTLFDTIGIFEPIASDAQIVGGDPMSWSDRGPGARNVVGADVVATGAFGTGDLTLNEVLWGAVATADFGGTSMATPVAAGNLALIYDAWHDRTGLWPTFSQARQVLMGSAKQTSHDVWTQGAGLVNADAGTDLAAGLAGAYATPAEWSAGNYRGTDYTAFAHIIAPGGSDSQTFTLRNTTAAPVSVTLRAERFEKIGTQDLSFRSLNQSLDHGNANTPDYVFRIDQGIPAGTDMVQVRLTKPYEQFDPDDDLFEPFNNWRVHVLNWTDLDHDGKYWVDANSNTKVDLGEMDANETVRFSYGYNTGPTQQARVANLDRIADGMLVGLRHRDQVGSVPQTDLTIEVSYWQRVPWTMITVPSGPFIVPAGGTLPVGGTINVPASTPLGMYEGAIIADDGQGEQTIPVTAAVAGSGTGISFGDTPAATTPYDNGRLFGYTDYDWRAESGDWRFYWTDIAASDLPTSGSSVLVVDTTWDNPGTDIDTLVMGPHQDCFSNGVDCPGFVGDSFPGIPPIYGPYGIEPVGGSVNTHIGSGRWVFQTATGGPHELVGAPLREGLHGIFLHQVRVDGSTLDDAFAGSAGLVNVDPGEITGTGSGTETLTISSEVALGGFVADAFGLSQPSNTTETVNQDDPADPSTASFSTTVSINHGARLDVSTGGAPGNDIDLYVYGPDGSLVAASTTSTDEEFVSILFPSDGTYRIDVHGWNVPGGSTTFDLGVLAVQGTDIEVSDLPASIPAGGSDTVTVSWDTTGKAPGTYVGLILMGPAEAPGLLAVPVEIEVP